MSNTAHLQAPPGIARGFYYLNKVIVTHPHGRRLPAVRIRIRDDESHARKDLLQYVAAALAMIKHPNVERLFGTSTRGGFYCITTRPWANGGTLQTYLAINAGANRLEIALAVAGTLMYLHTTTPTKAWIVIHGNVHTTTVLMHCGRPLLSDFALCRIIPEPANAGRRPAMAPNDGIITSKAPEIQDTGLCSIPADVYAFGMLLFELAAGHGPFTTLSPYGAAARLLVGQRPERSELQLVPNGDAVWRIISSCWSHQPEQRPQMSNVYADLRQLVQS